MSKLDPYFWRVWWAICPRNSYSCIKPIRRRVYRRTEWWWIYSWVSRLTKNYAGRPTAPTLCENLTAGTKTKVIFKAEDLLHGGAHKDNSSIKWAKKALLALSEWENWNNCRNRRWAARRCDSTACSHYWTARRPCRTSRAPSNVTDMK